MRSKDHSSRAEQTHTQTNRAVDPRLAQFPARKEPVFVVVQICLSISIFPPHIQEGVQLTTRQTAPT